MSLQVHQSLLRIFRRDRILGLWLALLLLIVPSVQPLAEANSAEKPFSAVICSTFGVAGEAAIPGLANDCAACIAGQHAPVLAVTPSKLEAEQIALVERTTIGVRQQSANPLSPSDSWKLKPPGRAPPAGI